MNRSKAGVYCHDIIPLAPTLACIQSLARYFKVSVQHDLMNICFRPMLTCLQDRATSVIAKYSQICRDKELYYVILDVKQ